MSNDGWYYLHVNGSLMFKRFEPDPGDFIKRIWKINTTNRSSAWIIAAEALALGANKERVFELKEKWKLTDEDAKEFARRMKLKIFKDGDQWCATFNDFKNLQESQTGFGATALEAFANLIKDGLCEI